MAEEFLIPTVAEKVSRGENIDILFWVGCAGSFDVRLQKVIRDMTKILRHVKIDFAILGNEESCTGDPAKRAGNEFLFQMCAVNNVSTLNNYEIKKIVTVCPHCFNTFKNDYPSFGGNYEVLHHSQLIQQLIDEGKLRFKGVKQFRGKKITYHDPCYLGRANNIYEAPRKILEQLDADFVEMKNCKKNGFCCGAGGASIFKEAEKGNEEVHTMRTRQALYTKANIIATACPFCLNMMTDGLKDHNKEKEVRVQDISELVVKANNLE